MLDKLSRNRFLNLAIIFFTASCSWISSPKIVNTQIICPHKNTRILIKFAEAEDVKSSIWKFYMAKKKNKSSEKYTVIILKGERSFAIKNMPPEEMIRCSVKTVPYGYAEANYVIY